MTDTPKCTRNIYTRSEPVGACVGSSSTFINIEGAVSTVPAWVAVAHVIPAVAVAAATTNT